MKKDFEKKIALSPKNIPISGLYRNWAFTVDEIANTVFRAGGQDMGGKIVVGYGGSVEDAVQNCIKRAERIDNPYQGCNILWLLVDKVFDIVGLWIRKFRGMKD